MRRIAFLCILVALSFGGAARAEEFKAGSLTILDVWSRASAAKTGVVFLTIRNDGAADRLVGVSTGAAAKAQIHVTTRDGDIVRMRPVDGIDVPAHGKVTLEPGGAHVMLMGLKSPLIAGSSLPVTLKFAKVGTVAVTVAVKAAGATAPGHDGMDKMDMSTHAGMKMDKQ